MENLRLALLKEKNSDRIEHLIKELNVEDVYSEFCAFYEKCEVLHIEIAPSVRKYVVDFIMKYRWTNSQLQHPTNIKCDIPGRTQLLIDILDENLNGFSNSLDDEKIHLLLFLARIMNVLSFNAQQQRIVPWTELRFMICIYVATKTDKYHTKYPLIDFHFQLLVDEEFILNNLEKLLETLKNRSNTEKWTDLKKNYQSTRYYYEMQKIWYHLQQLQPHHFDDYLKNELIIKSHFQPIGESLKEIAKIGISKEKRKITPLTQLFSFEKVINSFISMRNPLSHGRAERTDNTISTLFYLLKASMVKMDIIILDLIHGEQILILNNYISKLIKETCSKKLLSIIDQIDTQQINNWRYNSVGIGTRMWLVELIKTEVKATLNHITRTSQLYDKLEKESKDVLKAWEKLKVTNISDFSYILMAFFRSVKNRHSLAKDITIKLQNISLNQDNFKSTQDIDFCDAISKLQNFVTENSGLFFTILWMFSNQQIRLIEKFINKSEDYKIESLLQTTLNCINNSKEKRKFELLKNNLITKRQLYNDYNNSGDLSIMRQNWPKNDDTIVWNHVKVTYDDPLKVIISKSKENLPDFKVVELFLEKINFKSKDIIIQIEEKERKELKARIIAIKQKSFKKNNQFAGRMLLNVYEISKLLGTEFATEPNYMDDFCLLPMGRPLRNFIAHGDIYMDLFLRDRQTIVENQLQKLFKLDTDRQVMQGISCTEDFKYLKEHFYEQKQWIKTFIGPINIKAEVRFPLCNNLTEEFITMTLRVRDVHGLTFVHHNLKVLDKNNNFFMYLIGKLTSEVNFQVNDTCILEVLIRLSSPDRKISPMKPESTFRDYLIDDIINESDIYKKHFILILVLCFNCPDIDLFKKLYCGFEKHSGLITLYACSFKQTDIVKYIIENQYLNNDFVLRETLNTSILSDNYQLAEYLIEKVPTPGSEYLKSALRRANLEMVKLLIEHGAELYYSSVYENVLYQFGDTSISEYLVKKYPQLINHNDSQLLFEACIWRNEKLMRFLVEKGANLNNVRKEHTVLMCACVSFNCFKIVKYLVEKGANIDSKTNSNALITACEKGNLEIVKFLLGKGADPSYEHGSISSLNKAIEQQSYKIAQELFKSGAKINDKTVMTAISTVEKSFLKYLIQRDNRIDWIINSLDIVISSEKVELVDEMLNHLKKSEFKLNIDHFRGALKSINVFQLLLKYPYQRLTQLDWSELLFSSLMYLDSKEMKVIIDKGANINYKRSPFNTTVLHVFFYNYNLFDNSMLRFLLNSGSDIRAKDKDGQTPIQIAKEKLDEKSFQEVLQIIEETKGTY